MHRAVAVVGSSYGDEGKGLAVDYFTSQLMQDGLDVTIVRHNGGAQAAHTVVTPGGRRHVFHSIGSGTLLQTEDRIVETHFARDFILHPKRIVDEWESLRSLVPGRIHLTADGQNRVSLFYDMMLCQLLELSRGDGRHGSCGLGINETVVRHDSGLSELRLTYDEVRTGPHLRLKRKLALMEHWFWDRMRDLDVNVIPLEYARRLRNYSVDAEVDLLEKMARSVNIVQDHNIGSHEAVIFEGAQGLALDGVTTNPNFPHVTRSRTGTTNVVRLLDDMDFHGELEVCYVTRNYLTRHGAGPLPDEGKPTPTVVDPTNQQNEWQGALRVAPICFEGLENRLLGDYKNLHGRDQTYPTMFVTHMDHRHENDRIPVVMPDGEMEYWDFNSFTEKMEGMFDSAPYLSFGPTRATVQEPSQLVL